MATTLTTSCMSSLTICWCSMPTTCLGRTTCLCCLTTRIRSLSYNTSGGLRLLTSLSTWLSLLRSRCLLSIWLMKYCTSWLCWRPMSRRTWWWWSTALWCRFGSWHLWNLWTPSNSTFIPWWSIHSWWSTHSTWSFTKWITLLLLSSLRVTCNSTSPSLLSWRWQSIFLSLL